ncbi:MAG: YqeG family HAD IIIA-type phosphatase [Oscillospiraceae bacterium]|nr:YqeG family HAD IIIA-type phosphatase [Oscillospiraceae bacterium]
MPFFHPAARFGKVTDITADFLRTHGIRALVLDVDNTLTTHNNPDPDKAVLSWIGDMKKQGIGLILLSNNSVKRVRPFAEGLGLDFTAWACKPLTFGLYRAAKRLGLSPKNIAMVGDQIFTDIIAGNLLGCMSIFVTPMEPEAGPFFRLKRKIERMILK